MRTGDGPDPGPDPHGVPDWDVGRLSLRWPGRPLVMGIVNLTPDSFYPGSRRSDPDAAVEFALGLADQGADILDLGAESSRPGATPIGQAAELDRLLPVLERLRPATRIPLSIDTIRSGTAQAALTAGADIVNDISACSADESMLELVAEGKCGLVLMHMKGRPATMQEAPHYGDVVEEVAAWLAARQAEAVAAGIPGRRILVDPGIGFGKTLDHNLSLLHDMQGAAAGLPFLVGASRKRFIGDVTGADAADRLPGSLAALALAHAARASVVRVHDVAASVQFLEVLAAADAASPGRSSDPR